FLRPGDVHRDARPARLAGGVVALRSGRDLHGDRRGRRRDPARLADGDHRRPQRLVRVPPDRLARPGQPGPGAEPDRHERGAGYVLVLDDLTTGKRVATVGTTGQNWWPPTPLADGHVYRWRVSAKNASGLGLWSPATDFRVDV